MMNGGSGNPACSRPVFAAHESGRDLPAMILVGDVVFPAPPLPLSHTLRQMVTQYPASQRCPMSKIYKLPLVLEPQPEGGYVVTCPLLPELITEGETVQEAIRNANDALEAIEAFEDLNRPLPSVLQPTKENAPIWVATVLAVT